MLAMPIQCNDFARAVGEFHLKQVGGIAYVHLSLGGPALIGCIREMCLISVCVHDLRLRWH